MLIELHEVVKTYSLGKTEVRALNGVNLEIDTGEYVALMGPSGSGKSTLMHILGCLDTPDTGQYLFNGQDTARLNDRQLARLRNRAFGFVFQNFNLLPRLSALAQVELPMLYAGINRRDRIKRANELLNLVGLKDRLHHRPNELSGGEMQRVAIARALANEPRVILADEPTGNLDSRSGAEIMSLFDRLAGQGRTIIIVTHDPAIAEHTRRIIRLRDGQIIHEQTVQSLPANPVSPPH
uniref:ABC transporter ATP-binding protein n=1 Tax=candidate division WOR-3 bacterium TaxID=2052148 RepID=A0A7V3PTS7_UNCW3